jgi:hypothetical protein
VTLRATILLLASSLIALIASPRGNAADPSAAGGSTISFVGSSSNFAFLATGSPIVSTVHNGIPFALHSMELTNYVMQTGLITTYRVHQYARFTVTRTVASINGVLTTNRTTNATPEYYLSTQMVGAPISAPLPQ